MSWIDVAAHLAGEALSSLWHAIEGHAEDAAKAIARKYAIERSAAALARALDRLPATVVGDELRGAALQLVDAAGLAMGLSHDDRAALYHQVLVDLVGIDLRRVAALAGETVHAFDHLNKNEAIP